MKVDTAQAIIRTQCNTHDAAEPLRRCLETEAPALLRTIRMYVARAGVAEGGDVETAALEVLSRTAVEALKSPERFDPARPPKAWLLGIAGKIILRVQRKRAQGTRREIPVSRLGTPEDERDEDIFDRLAEITSTLPEDAAIASEAVRTLLALVSPDDQRVLLLGVVCGLDGARLAQELGISRGAARVRLSRARDRLQAAYRQREARHGQA
jgi:RNA polymerase sigma-70 factor (ECF subfamily)